VLFFSAKWSEECKLMNDVIVELSKDEKNSQLRVLIIEAEDHETITVKYGVEAVPTFVFINVIIKIIFHLYSAGKCLNITIHFHFKSNLTEQ
jgi:thiol-disulfide isomerase/thioredoxin